MIRVLHTGLRAPKDRKGIQLIHRPALVSEVVRLDTNLVAKALSQAREISFFSPRAITSLSVQGIGLPDLPISVVGTKTEECLLKKFARKSDRCFSTFSAFCESKGDSDGIISFELENSPHSVSQLSEKHCVMVAYRTKETELVVGDISFFDWIVFTSPKGASAFFSQVSLDDYRGEFACLGETTYRALKSEHGIEASFEKTGSITVDELLDRIESFI